MNFDNLGLSDKVLAAVNEAGFDVPTPIQAQAIPIAVTGRDVLGIAQTGTGKTASFVLPMLTRLERGRARARMPRSLIIAPTRELAAQVAEAFTTLGTNHKLEMALLIGGVSFDEQNRKLDRGADVLIATPGRLLDHFERGKLLLTAVEILVIDEADRMLDMGFIPDIERICKLLPPKHQTLFFSATMPAEIQKLVNRFLKDPERIEVAPPSTTAQTITQKFYYCDYDPKLKRESLREVIKSCDVKNGIIFCNRKRDVDILYKSLKRHDFDVVALHGDMDQHHRTKTLDAFRNGEVTFLVASDVAARGLDIPEVSHVFNYDVPMQAEDYVHRIGRTGRAGRHGNAATLVTIDDLKVVREIEKTGGEALDWIGNPPGEEDEALAHSKKRGRGRRSPQRGRQAGERDNRGSASSERTDRGSESGERTARTGARKKAADKRTEPAPRPPRKSRRPAEKDDKPVVGLGEHVPEFLKRPVRVSGD